MALVQCTCAIVATNQAGKKPDGTKCVTVFENLGLNVSIFKEQTHALLIALATFCNMTSLTYGSLLHWHGRSVDCKGAANQAGMWGFCTLQGIEYALKRLSKGYIVQVRCWEFSFEISNTFIEKCCQKPSCWSQNFKWVNQSFKANAEKQVCAERDILSMPGPLESDNQFNSKELLERTICEVISVWWYS